MGYGISDVPTDVKESDCTLGCADIVRESALKVDSGRKNFLSHRASELE